MDLFKTIKELHEEKRRIDLLISILEERAGGEPAAGPKRRGRKTMSEQERKEVSRRMRSYWAAKKKGGAPEGPASK